ncbi:hypothetical protein K443DRAFT_680222 [Laccaria amethystina LaAM-08-1]|jgi:hypothetical protein|uniref:Uncharacterized protein n=1 Tax=Laccaria amethystina LaAM-08-1 TaxID=1095629 RepID=A0A0C9X1Z1_9AGAR|nr:hypothetical protein K443DRAFT_680222 [Laccaria amethystina LaAM-08-1]
MAGEAKQQGLAVVTEACNCPLCEGGRSVDHNGACLPRSRPLSVSDRGGRLLRPVKSVEVSPLYLQGSSSSG